MKASIAFVAFVIIYFVNLLFVRYLWNNSLVKHVTILQPTTTLLETFLLALAITMITSPAWMMIGFTGGFADVFMKGLANAK